MSKTTFGFLDNDFYQFTMSQAIWEYYGHFKVRYRFRNRTFAVPLASRIELEVIDDHIHEVREASKPTEEDIQYLEDTDLFKEEYLRALRDVSFPPVKLGIDNGHLVMTYEGDWWESVFWETPLLYTVNQLYYNRFGSYGPEGIARLQDKIRWLIENPDIKFADMGTRRRFSPYWQRTVLERMKEECSSLIGTSNVHLARELELKPIGTMAHQLFMVVTAEECYQARLALDVPNINGAQQQVLDRWEELYGDFPEMLTFLPDTYGTEYFLAGTSKERMETWGAIRQDSGDPLDICARMIRWMRANGIDPSTKRILPSDNLDLRRMALLYDTFAEHTNISFGFGTGLTNDVGFEPLSIVIKPDALLYEGEEIPCVKISDSPAKATGTPWAIAEYKKLIGIDEL